MTFLPIGFISDGRALIPLDRFRTLFQRQFRVGEEYTMMPTADRSSKAQGLYFKCIKVAFENLPERWQRRHGGPGHNSLARFPTETHLRRWCLIQEGFALHREIPCRDEDAAKVLVETLRDMDPYCVIQRRGDVLSVWLALSQDKHTMGKDMFQQSMDKVLGRLANMLDVSVDNLTEMAKSAMVRRGTEGS